LEGSTLHQMQTDFKSINKAKKQIEEITEKLKGQLSDSEKAKLEHILDVQEGVLYGEKAEGQFDAGGRPARDGKGLAARYEAAVVFDDVRKFASEQRQGLSIVPHLMQADMNGFTRGINMFDMAVTKMTGSNETMSKKLAEIKDAVKN